MGFRFSLGRLVLVLVGLFSLHEGATALGGVLFSFQQPTYLIETDTALSDFHCDETKADCKINFNFETSFVSPEKSTGFTCTTDFDVGAPTGEEIKCNPNTVTFPVGLHSVQISIVSKTNSGVHVERTIRVFNRVSESSSSTGSTNSWSTENGSWSQNSGTDSQTQTGTSDVSTWSVSPPVAWLISSGSFVEITASGAMLSGVIVASGSEARVFFGTGNYSRSASLMMSGIFTFTGLVEQTSYVYRIEAYSWETVLSSATGSFRTLVIPLVAQTLLYCDQDLDEKVDTLTIAFNKTVTGSIDLGKLLLYSDTGWLASVRIGTQSGYFRSSTLSGNILILSLVPQDLTKHTLRISSSTSSDLRLKMNEDMGLVDLFGQPMERFGLTTSFSGYNSLAFSSCVYPEIVSTGSSETGSLNVDSSSGNIFQPFFIIREINWAGTDQSSADEWIRFENVSTGSLSLSGWSASGILGMNAYHFPDRLLASGTLFTISNYAHSEFHSDFVTTSVNLSNEHLDISLINPVGEVVDSFVGSPCFLSDKHIMLRKDFSGTGCSFYDPISFLSETGSLDSTGGTSSGSMSTSSWSSPSEDTSSGWISVPAIHYTLQSPSNLIFLTGSQYICSSDICRMNIDLSLSFSGVSASDYTCSISSDFPIDPADATKCNPPTLYIPSGLHTVTLRISLKNDRSHFSEQILTITHSSPILTGWGGGSVTDFSSLIPIITVQSWLSGSVCDRFPCRVNVRYIPSDSHEYCRWNFGSGIFKSGTERRCDPSVVLFPSGNHMIHLEVFDRNSSFVRSTDLSFSAPIPPEKESLLSLESTGSVFITVVSVNWGSFSSNNSWSIAITCPFSSGCSVTFEPRTQSGFLGHMLRYEWNAGSGRYSEAQKPRFFLGTGSHVIWLFLTDYGGKTWELSRPVSVSYVPEILKDFPSYSGQLRIAWVVPNPSGSDDFEMIEIENIGTGRVSLDHCSLDDRIGKGSSRAFRFESWSFLDPGTSGKWFGIVTGVRLDNKDDEANLLCDGQILDTVAWHYNTSADYVITHDSYGISSPVIIDSFSWETMTLRDDHESFAASLLGVSDVSFHLTTSSMRVFSGKTFMFEMLSWSMVHEGYLSYSWSDVGYELIRQGFLIPDWSTHRLSSEYASALWYAQKNKTWIWSQKDHAKALRNLLKREQTLFKAREEKRKRLKQLESFFWNPGLLSRKKSQLVTLFQDNAEVSYMLHQQVLSISGITIPRARVELSFSSGVAIKDTRIAFVGDAELLSLLSFSTLSPQISLTNTQTRIYTTQADGEGNFSFSLPFSQKQKPIFSLITRTNSGEVIPFFMAPSEIVSVKSPQKISSGSVVSQKTIISKTCSSSIKYQPTKTHPSLISSGVLNCVTQDGVCKLNFTATPIHSYCDYRWFLDNKLVASTVNPRAFEVASGSHMLTLSVFPKSANSGIKNSRVNERIIVISTNSWRVLVPKKASIVSGELASNNTASSQSSSVPLIALVSLGILSWVVYIRARFSSR